MGRNPFPVESSDHMIRFRKIVKDIHDPPTGLSNEATKFVNLLLVKEPTMRLGSRAAGDSEIMQHEWFSEIGIRSYRKRNEEPPWVPSVKNPLDASCFDDWSELMDKTLTRHQPLRDEKLLFASF